VWCRSNNLSLNVSKTKELIVHYRKQGGYPNQIDVATVEQVDSFKFLGIQITKDLKMVQPTHT
jgi:hypothetical protein